MSRTRRIVGSTLLVLGAGLLALVLGPILDPGPTHSSSDTPGGLALGAMLVVGGWLLRRP